jgi:tRNA pseudouridine55 synthase
MPRRGAGRLHGYLVIDKPAGWTSHDVVARVRRLTGERKVGHAGTLDPAATGVLPVAVGIATRTLEMLSESSKTYRAEVTFGVRTDTYDADGSVVSVADPADLTPERVAEAVRSMRGRRMQVPPMYSAIKIGGRPLYERARRGEVVERVPREIEIHAMELLRWEPPVLDLCIDCSKGTYIRSIAFDLGEMVGCGAYLSNLVRIRSGPFHIDEAWTIIELAESDLESAWESIAVHPDIAAAGLAAVVIEGQQADGWQFGRPIGCCRRVEPVRVYDAGGEWLGIAEATEPGGPWRPAKVIPRAA